jgi:hypothetical protein
MRDIHDVSTFRAFSEWSSNPFAVEMADIEPHARPRQDAGIQKENLLCGSHDC